MSDPLEVLINDDSSNTYRVFFDYQGNQQKFWVPLGPHFISYSDARAWGVHQEEYEIPLHWDVRRVEAISMEFTVGPVELPSLFRMAVSSSPLTEGSET